MSEVGGDVGKTAVAAVNGAVKFVAAEIGTDTVKAKEKATSGAKNCLRDRN